jgi:uncharacterized membrane protein YdjX (TVP38/TMEM64 family)
MSPVSLLRRYGLLIVVVGLLIALLASGAWRWLSLAQLQAHHAQLRALVTHRPLISLAVLFVVFVAVVAACIPGPSFMALVSGYLFGFLIGGLISLAACVSGAVVVFLACRGAFADTLARRAGPRARRLEKALNDNAFSYLLTLKLIPVVPMFVANVAAGLAGVRPSSLVAASVLGSAPICFILAGLGAGVSHVLDHGGALDPHMFRQPGVILPVIGLSVLSIVTLGWRLLRRGRA